ncbi:MAG: tRNA epoxyqueuosine(34) reductase QueG [Planctomycetota bacterium]
MSSLDTLADDFTTRLKSQAAELGFALSGVTAAAVPNRLDAFHRWLDSGFHGSMEYLETRRDAYSHPRHVLEGCRSILMLGFPYWHRQLEAKWDQTASSKVARYAMGGADYHDIIHAKLKRLKRWVLTEIPDANVRGVVDTAPLLEREFGELAGLGWTGKNTLLLNREHGSYFFLAALLLDQELPNDASYPKSFCGTCTACLDHCPTSAFPEPFVLDATKCISYLTIEHRDFIHPEIAEQFQGWSFGCDVCQEVCPWNRKAAPAENDITNSAKQSLEPAALLELDEASFRERFRKTPFWRPRRRGILRNALLALASSEEKLSELGRHNCEQLVADDEPIVRMTAAWTLKKKQTPGWRELLQTAAEREDNEEVRACFANLLADV